MKFSRLFDNSAFIASWIIWINIQVEISAASTFDGDEWSAWSSWSSCTRTCDGGVTQQFRRCISSHGCHGVSIRRKMCNMQPCTEYRDYRSEQCKAFNGIEYKNRRRTWEAIEDADNPCALTCRAEGTDIIAKLSAKLRDGTRCKSGALHVCVDGRCEAVGCDLKLGSPKKVDECGVCGGDGSTCSTPVYRWEISPTTQCSATCGGGQQGVRVICRNSLTNDRVDQLLCDSEQKPYRAFQSCNIHPCQPAWKTGEWSQCSKTCGGGLLIRKVICTQEKNSTAIQVADKLCLHIRKPINQETCNLEPCPHWHVGPWSACSKTCGEDGIKTRNVVCRNAHNLPSSNCDPRLLPPDTRACQDDESPPCPTIPTTPLPTTPTTTTTTTTTRGMITSTDMARNSSVAASLSLYSSSSSVTMTNPTYPLTDPFFDPREEETDEDFIEELPREHTLPLIQPYPPMDNAILFDRNAVPSEATKVRVFYSCGWLFLSFVAEEWGPCSQTCGEGVRRRDVKCKIFLEFSRTIANLPDKECPGPKPSEKESCFARPCPLPLERESEDLENLSDSHHAALADSDSGTNNFRKTITVGLPPGISMQDMTFSWKVSGYTPCSASCLGGIQEAMIQCVRDYDQRIATPVLCMDKPQPDIATTRTCNDHPCPPRWNVSDFGPCSKPCGGGVMTREVNCIHEVTRGNTVIVPNNICPQPVPRTERLCNTVNCPPYWEPGEWDRCSKPCGGGIRTRPLYCKQIIALGQIVEWPNENAEGHCTQPRPLDYRPCNKKPCNRAKQHEVGKQAPGPNDSTSTHLTTSIPTFIQQEWKKKLALSVKGQATVYQGVSLKLRCPGSGKSSIDRTRIVWMKDHHYVHIQTNKIEVIPKSGILKIKNTTFSDSGIYTCVLNERPLSNLTLLVQPYTGPVEMGGSGGRTVNRQTFDKTNVRQRGPGPNGRTYSEPGGESTLFADQQPGVSVPISGGLEPTIITHSPKNFVGASSSCGRLRPQLFSLFFFDFHVAWVTWPLSRLLTSSDSTAKEMKMLGEEDEKGNQLLFEANSKHWKYDEDDKEEERGNFVEADDADTDVRGHANCQSESQDSVVMGDMTTSTRRKKMCANAQDDKKVASKASWQVGNWSDCSDSRCFTWNTSMKRREVTCQFPNGTTTLSTHCNYTRKPEVEQECYNKLCLGIWRAEPWSPCKSRCNSVGLKTRILKCVWHGSLQPAGNACRSLARPTVKKACRGPACLKIENCKDRSLQCSAIRMFNLCRVTLYQFHCCESCFYLNTYGLTTRFKKKFPPEEE